MFQKDWLIKCWWNHNAQAKSPTIFFLGVNFFGTPSRLILIRYTETNLKLCFQLQLCFKRPKNIFSAIGPSTIVTVHFEGSIISSESERVFLNHWFSLVRWGLVTRLLWSPRNFFQKNPLCANKRGRAGVISRSRVYYCNEFAFYIFPVYSSVVARYLRSTCCKSTFQAPTLSWYRQVKNFRIGCSSKSKINFCDLAT